MGITSLRWSKLAEAMLDAEINMKNRHLIYIEEDVHQTAWSLTETQKCLRGTYGG